MSSQLKPTEADKGTVRLYRLVELATRRLRLLPGEIRMVAWTSDEIPGMHVSPHPAQNTTQTLVLAHLRRGRLAEPMRDKNVSDDHKEPTFEEPDTEPAPGDEKTIDATKTPPTNP